MIAIIDYLAGNAPSVLSAVKHLGYEGRLVSDSKQLDGATRIILPGVGSAGATMKSLNDAGFIEPLTELVHNNKIPFLGVCVGMQILFEHSQEEDAECLGWLKGNAIRFDHDGLRVPQMGWNLVEFKKNVPFVAVDDYFYFVNSYHVCPDEDVSWGVTEYGAAFTSAVNKNNIYGTQFHIEKSGPAGLGLLKGFIEGGAKC